MPRALPSVWRIAILVAFLVCAGLALFLGYQYFWLNNARVMESLSSFDGNPILGIALFVSLFATFIVGLITFPYYFFGAFLGGFRGSSATDTRAFVVGFGTSVACILIALAIAERVFGLDGGRL